MTPTEACVTAQDVSWRVGYRWIVTQISLEARRGEVTLLVGGNGSGKTTLLRLLSGLVKPTVGTVIRRTSVGLVAHQSMLYDALSGRENLAFVSRLQAVYDPARVEALLERMGLSRAADQRIATYSRGMLQRLAIARALLGEPELLLLDEPLTGLDENGIRIVREVISERCAKGNALVIATHQLVELVDLAASVGYLVSGRLAALEPVDGRDAGAIMARYHELVANGA